MLLSLVRFLRRRFVFLFLVLAALFSCAANYPSIKKTQCSVIFSYDSQISYPSLSMSVFVAAASPYNRISSMKVAHDESKLEWNIDSPEFVGEKKDKDIWFGSSRLIVPSHCDLPQGIFSVSVVDARLEKANAKINVEYPEKLLSMTLSEAEDTDEFNSLTVETLAIYGEKNEALYIGPRISDFSTDEQILSYYSDAEYYNIVKTSESGKFAVVLPTKYFVERTTPDDSDDFSEDAEELAAEDVSATENGETNAEDESQGTSTADEGENSAEQQEVPGEEALAAENVEENVENAEQQDALES